MEVVRPFEEIYKQAARKTSGHASDNLKMLLHTFYNACLITPPDLIRIQRATVSLLKYLVTQEGRTHANCCTVDLFVEADNNGINWQELPEELTDVIGDMCTAALHDTIVRPDIAENFGGTPEQLLEQALKLHYE